jgi:hypothetical protein
MLVPADFDVPLGLEGPGFRLEPLGPEHNERDHEAWMSSLDHIRATPGWAGSDWPHPMSLEDNRRDLERHAADFEARRGFTYSVLDGDDVIGCVYIYPSSEGGAEVHSWVRASRAEMDRPVWQGVSQWLAEAWPLDPVRYAGR